MIRSAALAVPLLALLASRAPPALAQEAPGTEAAAPKKRATTRAARKTEAAQPAAAPTGQEAQPQAEEAPAKGRRGAAKRVAKPAAAAGKADAKGAPPGLQASQVATFGEWSVYAAGEGKARICYAIAQPQARLPKSLKRDPAYLFVTVRKAEKVANEVALMMGFAPKPPASPQTASTAGAAPASAPADPTLAIGAAKYTLVVKETNAWLQNPADEGRVVGEMARGPKVVVKAVSLRGNASTDEYALKGFSDAIKRAREECK